MKYEIYVIKGPSVINLLIENNLEGLRELLNEDSTLLFNDPVEFKTKVEALAFCVGFRVWNK